MIRERIPTGRNPREPRVYTATPTGKTLALFWRKVDKSNGPDACWTWTASTIQWGHGHFWNQEGYELSHRFSWRVTNGPIPAGAIVCHRCDNPPCVNPAHLFLGTHADNVADMIAKGRVTSEDRRRAARRGDNHPFRLRPETAPRGERNRHAKLTAERVLAIREAAACGESRDELATRHGVARTTIDAIVQRKTWRHV